MMCFSILQDIFFRRDKTEANRVPRLLSRLRKSTAIKNTQKMFFKEIKIRQHKGPINKIIHKGRPMLRKSPRQFFLPVTHFKKPDFICLWVRKRVRVKKVVFITYLLFDLS